jgi:hypothetical protein
MTAFNFRLVFLISFLTLAISAPSAIADEGAAVSLSPKALIQLGRADRALRDLDGLLKSMGFERPAIIGVNYFAISVGGIDALRDLEEGRGVDPETLAGLLSGFARPEVAEHLNLKKISGIGGEVILKIDAADGRLRYKGTVVRLYSPARLAELYDRREDFRLENVRKRNTAFGNFVSARRRELGTADQQADKSAVTDLADRYQAIQPVLGDLTQTLESEVGATSILQGTTQHFFGLSIGGINAVADLTQSGAVDPETLGAIYAQRTSAEYADGFQYSEDGRILYSGIEVKLYSVKRLEECFKLRDRLVLQTN